MRDHLEARQLNKFERGHEIGSLAWKLFPGGIDCSPKHPAAYAKAAAKTTELIRRGATILYEAVFEYDGIRVLPDILVLNDSQIRMYEVKGSLNISQTYILDAALQYYVISGAGYTPSQTFILHVNKNYIYEGGEIHPEDFFVFQAEDGIRDLVRSRGLGDVYKRQGKKYGTTGANKQEQKPRNQMR